MKNWKPINDSAFADLFNQQYAQLNNHQRDLFDKFRIPFFKAILSRSEAAGNETVFVVARKGDGVLYFDDVEYGFNIARIDPRGRILNPGGSQNTLKEAIELWFTDELKK